MRPRPWPTHLAWALPSGLPMRQLDERTCPACPVGFELGWMGVDLRIRRIDRTGPEPKVREYTVAGDPEAVRHTWRSLLAGETA